MLDGAKLASATILQTNPFGMDPIKFALLVIAVMTILYTVVGDYVYFCFAICAGQ